MISNPLSYLVDDNWVGICAAVVVDLKLNINSRKEQSLFGKGDSIVTSVSESLGSI